MTFLIIFACAVVAYLCFPFFSYSKVIAVIMTHCRLLTHPVKLTMLKTVGNYLKLNTRKRHSLIKVPSKNITASNTGMKSWCKNTLSKVGIVIPDTYNRKDLITAGHILLNGIYMKVTKLRVFVFKTPVVFTIYILSDCIAGTPHITFTFCSNDLIMNRIVHESISYQVSVLYELWE